MNVPANVNQIHAFGDLLDLISTAAGRRAFLADPERSTATYGDLPADLRDHLSDLSASELRVLADLNRRVNEAGLTGDAGGRTLGFF
jgi:hypothetical protein